MYCPKCGTENPEGASYCQKCGAVLAQTAPVSPRPVAMETGRTSGMAIASLVCGILGFFFGLLSVLAIIFGAIAMSQMTKDPNLKGKGMAVAGLVMGIVSIAITILVLIFVGSFFWFI